MSKLDKIEELQNILKEDHSNFQARRQLAVLLLDSGFPKEALQHWTKKCMKKPLIVLKLF